MAYGILHVVSGLSSSKVLACSLIIKNFAKARLGGMIEQSLLKQNLELWFRIRSDHFLILSNLWTKQCQNALPSALSELLSACALRRSTKCHPPVLPVRAFFRVISQRSPLQIIQRTKRGVWPVLGISHYLACRSNLAKHIIVCYLWPPTVGNQLLDLHSHNENQLVMTEFKLIRSVMIESNLSRSECVVLQTPHAASSCAVLD